MKRSRHVGITVSSILALSVSIAALLAVTMPAGAGAATLPRWIVAADSGATPPAPAPAPAPEPAPPPAPAPAPAPADTAAAPPTTPAPIDTLSLRPAPAAVPGDTLSAPLPPVPAPSVAPPPAPAPPPPLTREQLRAQAWQMERTEKAAAWAAKYPKKVKKPDVDPLAAWNKGKTWITLRGGYAKSTEPGAAGGAVGAGLGIQHFLTARWALGLVGHGDLLGKFGGAAEIEYPITLELTRHFRWQTALRPYLGAGGGAFYHKFYRTGSNAPLPPPRCTPPLVEWSSGGYMVGGANLPVSKRSILGFDGRMAFVDGNKLAKNPVFGAQRAQLTHYSLKLSWSLAF